MKKHITLVICIILCLLSKAEAQKVYEFNEINEVPYLNSRSMHYIALTLSDLYRKAIITPDKFSTTEAAEQTFYLYYEGESSLKKVNPLKGAKFTSDNKDDLGINDHLTFNLEFDENGNIILKDKIFVVSYLEKVVDREYKKSGQLAFELPINDTIRSVLQNVKLQNVAKANKNSLSGGLSPVKVLVPFTLSFHYQKTEETKGVAKKRDDEIDIDITRSLKGQEEKQKIIDILKQQSEIMLYKKGKFQFIIEEDYYSYYLDVNIARGMLYSSQPANFSTATASIKSFTGEGKK